MKHESLNKQGIALVKKNQLNEAKLFFEEAIELKLLGLLKLYFSFKLYFLSTLA